jgi:hypothetical protein
MKVEAAKPIPHDLHRIGGGSIENLQLKPEEARLNPPGISVLKGPTPAEAAAQIRSAFPEADRLHEAAKVIGTSNTEKIRDAGFNVIPNASRKLPTHHRIIHPDGAAGFKHENLKRLSEAFTNTEGH